VTGHTADGDAARGPIALAFVGTTVPDTPEFSSEAAFSRAGALYQNELLASLQKAGLSPSLVLSVPPLHSVVHGNRRLWSRARKVPLASGLVATLPSFPNVTPAKQVVIGVQTMHHLARWAWRERTRPRAVLTYNLSVPPGLFTWLSARATGSVAIASLADVDVPGQSVPDSLWYRIDHGIQRRLIPRFDGLTVVSDAIRDDLAGGRPTLRLEGGVSRRMLQELPHANRTENDPFTVTAAGSLTEVNGIRLLLAALRTMPDFRMRVRIAGSGPLEQEVRKAASLDSRIEFLGLVGHDRVLELYASSDLLLNVRLTRALHTRWFFPSKLLEYLASGTAVLSTCTGHVEEEFGTFVYLLREESPGALGATLLQIASLPPEERRRRGRDARDYMLRHKSWDAQGIRLAEFIRSIVEVRTSGPAR
jgi:glycosyltransferase involved in cell wall biosynthesis